MSGASTVFYRPGVVNSRFAPLSNRNGTLLKRLVMPIPIHITARCGPLYRRAILDAFEGWSLAASGRLSYKLLARTPSPAEYAMVFDYQAGGWIGDEHALATTWFPLGFDIPSITYTATTINGRTTQWHRGEPFYVAAPAKPKNAKAKADYDNTVLHEMGHALGLDHSDKPESVMYPYIHQGGGTFSDDDIQGIRKLYV